MAQFNEKATVTIACGTSGAEIYYTSDGTAPSASSIKYSSPISFRKNKTIKAIGIKSGIINSDIATVDFTVKLPITTDMFHIINYGDYAEFEYNDEYDWDLFGAQYGFPTVYYTIGSGTEQSMAYSGKLKIDLNTTIKIKLSCSDNVDSDYITYTVSNLKVKTPTITVA